MELRAPSNCLLHARMSPYTAMFIQGCHRFHSVATGDISSGGNNLIVARESKEDGNPVQFAGANLQVMPSFLEYFEDGSAKSRAFSSVGGFEIVAAVPTRPKTAWLHNGAAFMPTQYIRQRGGEAATVTGYSLGKNISLEGKNVSFGYSSWGLQLGLQVCCPRFRLCSITICALPCAANAIRVRNTPT